MRTRFPSSTVTLLQFLVPAAHADEPGLGVVGECDDRYDECAPTRQVEFWSHQRAFANCVEGLSGPGSVVVYFDFFRDGRVRDANVASDRVLPAGVRRCAMEAVRGVVPETERSLAFDPLSLEGYDGAPVRVRERLRREVSDTPPFLERGGGSVGDPPPLVGSEIGTAGMGGLGTPPSARGRTWRRFQVSFTADRSPNVVRALTAQQAVFAHCYSLATQSSTRLWRRTVLHLEIGDDGRARLATVYVGDAHLRQCLEGTARRTVFPPSQAVLVVQITASPLSPFDHRGLPRRGRARASAPDGGPQEGAPARAEPR